MDQFVLLSGIQYTIKPVYKYYRNNTVLISYFKIVSFWCKIIFLALNTFDKIQPNTWQMEISIRHLHVSFP